MNNTLKIRNNGKFRIMVVCDAQDLQFIRPEMNRMLCRAYDDYKPDLILFNGDNILGNHLLDARFSSRKVAFGYKATYNAMIRALDKLLRPVESRGIPFGMVYGNHDDMNLLTKEEQIEIYRSYYCCLPMNTDDKQVDCDTYVITVTDNDGKPLWAVYMLDSAWQDKDRERKCHCEIKPQTVRWFKETSGKLRAENGGNPLPSIALMHIPLPAVYDLLTECDPATNGTVLCDDGKYRALDKAKANGVMREAPSVVTDDNGLFDAMAADSGVKAAVFGHDHLNCFEGRVSGIDILQTGAASFRCYGNIDTKGVRIIDLESDGKYSQKFLSYRDIMGDSLLNKIRYFNDADEYAVKKYGSLGVVALGAAATGTAALIYKKLKK